jgi:hypothetical protein
LREIRGLFGSCKTLGFFVGKEIRACLDGEKIRRDFIVIRDFYLMELGGS